MQDIETQNHDPYKYFQSTAHEIITQDAAMQLLKPGESLRDVMAKTNFPDMDYLLRFTQCIAKLEDSDLGENTEPRYRSGINLLINICNGLNSIKGKSRGEFNQGLARLFAPSYYELIETGKIASKEGKAQRKGFFKPKEQEEEQS